MRRVVIALLLALPCAAGAQDTTSAIVRGIVRGIVRDERGAPVAGAIVDVLSVGRVRADSAGAYRVDRLPAGTLIVRASMIGYAPAMKMVMLVPRQELRLDLTMMRATQELPTVVVREDSSYSRLRDPSGFDERRRKSVGGEFITADEIERTHTIDMRTLFYGRPGVQVDTDGIIVIKHGEISIRDFYAGGESCVGAQMVVDGIAMPQPFDINTITVSAVRGVEIYDGPATTPAELRTYKTVCGTVVIWTKRN